MPVVHICDADCTTILKSGEEYRLEWGYPRVYGKEAMVAVEKYNEILKDAAIESRELFRKHAEAAVKEFHKKYPDGLLPDEKEVVSDEA